MNREVEQLLSTQFEYLGSDTRKSNGDEITQWRTIQGNIIEIVVLEEDNREMEILDTEDEED